MKKTYAKISGKLTLITFIMLCCLPLLHSAEVRPHSAGFDNAQFDDNIGPRMKSIIYAHAQKFTFWVTDYVIINAVREQNNKNTPLETIKKIDKEWVAGQADDFALSLQTNKIGKILAKRISRNKKLYVEAFLCDAQGAVVGESPQTTDYWQGDEDKFIKSFNNGNGQLYVGNLEYDESAKTYAVQVSIPVLDEDKTIGVLVVGLRNIK